MTHRPSGQAPTAALRRLRCRSRAPEIRPFVPVARPGADGIEEWRFRCERPGAVTVAVIYQNVVARGGRGAIGDRRLAPTQYASAPLASFRDARTGLLGTSPGTSAKETSPSCDDFC